MKYFYRTLWVICFPLLVIITFALGAVWYVVSIPILYSFYFIRDGNLEKAPNNPFDCIICEKYIELINKLTPK